MKTAGDKKSLTTMISILVVVVLATIGMFAFLSNILKTETYYVLKDDVPARSQVTTEMLTPVTTSSGTAPKNALSLKDVQAGGVFAQYPLKAGDVLTPSNVGGFEDVAVGVPDNWVVTSFPLSPIDAMQDKIHRGVHFDVLAITPEGATYPFVNVLALDAVESGDGKQGTVYTVAMPPEDAARLHTMIANGTQLKLVLSPRANEYEKPKLDEYNGLFRGDGTVGDTKTSPLDLGAGTDYTFEDVKRDKFGRPTPDKDNCSAGNAKVSEADCEEYASTAPTPDENKDDSNE